MKLKKFPSIPLRPQKSTVGDPLSQKKYFRKINNMYFDYNDYNKYNTNNRVSLAWCKRLCCSILYIINKYIYILQTPFFVVFLLYSVVEYFRMLERVGAKSGCFSPKCLCLNAVVCCTRCKENIYNIFFKNIFFSVKEVRYEGL